MQKQREKKEGKVIDTVQCSIQVSQTRHGYFLGACRVSLCQQEKCQDVGVSKRKKKSKSMIMLHWCFFKVQRIFVHQWVPSWKLSCVLQGLLCTLPPLHTHTHRHTHTHTNHIEELLCGLSLCHQGCILACTQVYRQLHMHTHTCIHVHMHVQDDFVQHHACFAGSPKDCHRCFRRVVILVTSAFGGKRFSQRWLGQRLGSVSYTHLTLPTRRTV